MIRYPSVRKLDSEDLHKKLLTFKLANIGLVVLKGKASASRKEELEAFGFEFSHRRWELNVIPEGASDEEYSVAIEGLIRAFVKEFGEVLGMSKDRMRYKKLVPELLANY